MEEIVDGHDIPLRELTEEEATRDITLDRFNDYMCTVGEDFVDQHCICNAQVLGGWLLGKHPKYKLEICEVLNDSPIEQDFLHLYVENYNDNAEDEFYIDFAEFLNLTIAAKKRVNQILIQIDEHYNK
jgi:hypothetical protein